MTGQERDYDEVLSRVLHSTTDRIEPVGDGLRKIQARLAEPWLKRQWWLLRSETTTIGWVLAVRCQSWFNTMRSGLAAGAAVGGAEARASAKQPRHASNPPRISVGQAMAWLRPALAVAGAVVLVVAGVFAMGQLRATIGLENANHSSTSNSNQGSGPGSTNGSGSPVGSSAPSATQGSATPTKAGSTPISKVSSSPAFLVAPPPSPSTSPSPASSPTSPPPTSPPPSSPPPTPTSPAVPMPADSPNASSTP